MFIDVSKPWGFYKITSKKTYLIRKLLHINPLSATSIQQHIYRDEIWHIVEGNGMIFINGKRFKTSENMLVFIPKKAIHGVFNCDAHKDLKIAETQIGNHLSEQDIVRHIDWYGRESHFAPQSLRNQNKTALTCKDFFGINKTINETVSAHVSQQTP